MTYYMDRQNFISIYELVDYDWREMDTFKKTSDELALKSILIGNENDNISISDIEEFQELISSDNAFVMTFKYTEKGANEDYHGKFYIIIPDDSRCCVIIRSSVREESLDSEIDDSIYNLIKGMSLD